MEPTVLLRFVPIGLEDVFTCVSSIDKSQLVLKLDYNLIPSNSSLSISHHFIIRVRRCYTTIVTSFRIDYTTLFSLPS